MPGKTLNTSMMRNAVYTFLSTVRKHGGVRLVTVNQREIFHGQPIRQIEIQAPSIPVSVTSSSSNRIKVYLRGEIRGSDREDVLKEIYRLETERNDDHVEIIVRKKDDVLRNVSLRLDIAVPKRIFTEIKVFSLEGKVHISRIKAKRLVIQTTSGDIQLEEFIGSELQVGTSSGNVRLRGIDSRVYVSSESENMDIKRFIDGKWLDVQSGTGAIRSEKAAPSTAFVGDYSLSKRSYDSSPLLQISSVSKGMNVNNESPEVL